MSSELQDIAEVLEQGSSKRLDFRVLVDERLKVRPLRVHLQTPRFIVEFVLGLSVVGEEPI